MSIDLLQQKIRKMKSPLCFGYDPMPDRIPPYLLAQAREEFGDTTKALASAYEMFGRGLLDALAETVPAVQFQPVCFEAIGPEGLEVLGRLTRYARDKDYYVILDTSFSSIEEIAEVEARTCFGGMKIGEQEYAPYYTDAATLNAFFGTDGIRPFLPYCKEQNKAVFLLVRSSNRSGREVQDLYAGDRNIYTVLADLALRMTPEDSIGSSGFSPIGMIVGANRSAILKQLRSSYDQFFFLVIGYGAQGGRAGDVRYAFNRYGHGAVVCAARSIICAWQNQEDDPEGLHYAEQALKAAQKMRLDILGYVSIL